MILKKLQSITPKIDRTSGVFALVIVPTRELVLQTYTWFTKILKVLLTFYIQKIRFIIRFFLPSCHFCITGFYLGCARLFDRWREKEIRKGAYTKRNEHFNFYSWSLT